MDVRLVFNLVVFTLIGGLVWLLTTSVLVGIAAGVLASGVFETSQSLKSKQKRWENRWKDRLNPPKPEDATPEPRHEDDKGPT